MFNNSYTKVRVNRSGYSVLAEPILTQKRTHLLFDWMFFTVMNLVACQVTMERKYHWLLYLREPQIESSKVPLHRLQNAV